MRSVVIGGGHLAYFAVTTLREIDSKGRIVIIEFTSEKIEMLKKTFPYAEAIQQSVDKVEEYIVKNRSLIDILISATDSDALNLRYAKHSVRNEIPIVIAVLNNPLNEPIFRRENIKYLINPYKTITSKVKEIVNKFLANTIYEFSRINGGIYALKIEDARILRKVRNFILKNDPPFFSTSVDSRVRTSSAENIEVGDVVYVACLDKDIKDLLEKIKEGGK
ncbi:MAG: NAD-binding protein [Nitrososphaerota archaeon]